MQRSLASAPTRRLQAHYLPISPTTPSPPELGGALWSLRWVGCHGGAGVHTLLKLTGIGHDAGSGWPADGCVGPVPVVLVCRATGTGTAKASTAVQQWRESPGLRHVRLLGLAVIAASPKPVPVKVSERLLLMAGWVPRLWWIGWREDYLAADDVRTVGPAPDVVALRERLVLILEQRSDGLP